MRTVPGINNVSTGCPLPSSRSLAAGCKGQCEGVNGGLVAVQDHGLLMLEGSGCSENKQQMWARSSQEEESLDVSRTGGVARELEIWPLDSSILAA